MKEVLLTTLRDRHTPCAAFRKAAIDLSRLMAAETTHRLKKKARSVETPLENASGAELEEKPMLIPILRAGLAMLFAFADLYPAAPIGFFGIRRDEQTALPQFYYENIPPIQPQSRIFLLDPMLATGGSAKAAIARLIELGAKQNQIELVSIIAAKPGVQALNQQFPFVHQTIAAVDEHLNAHHYILPGLGDFGDRFFAG